MSRKLMCFLAFLLVGIAYIPTAHADEAIGYLFFDADPGSSIGNFEVVNQTGFNASGDATWPVDTQLTFSGPLSGRFNLHSRCGRNILGWIAGGRDGCDVADANRYSLSPTLVTLFDSSTVTLNSSFSAILSDPSGITGGDFAVIFATTGSVTPPPSHCSRAWVAGSTRYGLRRTGGLPAPVDTGGGEQDVEPSPWRCGGLCGATAGHGGRAGPNGEA